ncbi:LysE family translocator [Pseudonocardia bannensis]|uniref:LysE family translocator n=1 Tax=Pseudonocardia bannensis TaxID=630973 RepID=A0A848DK24_9PSEU|nr:LysE family translocator [Pseudonocardia bannensis]NMH93067.1 LysE family translocator [Pseudonocardia bannensis]
MGWLAVFFGAAVLIALTPGSNNLVGLHHGMTHGLGPSLVGLLGRLLAFALMVAAVAAGLAQVLAASGYALTVIKWVGVAYLAWLGGLILYRTWRHDPAAGLPEAVAGPDGAAVPPGAPLVTVLRKEFLVAITNPKAMLIFTAFMPQFVDPGRGPVAWQVAVLGLVYLLAEFLAGTVYIGAGAAVRSAALTVRARRNLDRATGGVLLGMAGALATSPT